MVCQKFRTQDRSEGKGEARTSALFTTITPGVQSDFCSSPTAQITSRIPPQIPRGASWMSWPASNYGLLNLIVDFNIINTRRGQIGVVSAELGFSSCSAICVLGLSHPVVQRM